MIIKILIQPFEDQTTQLLLQIFSKLQTTLDLRQVAIIIIIIMSNHNNVVLFIYVCFHTQDPTKLITNLKDKLKDILSIKALKSFSPPYTVHTLSLSEGGLVWRSGNEESLNSMFTTDQIQCLTNEVYNKVQ